MAKLYESGKDSSGLDKDRASKLTDDIWDLVVFSSCLLGMAISS